MAFEYHYRKGPFVAQSLFGIFYLAFILFWMYGAFSIVNVGRGFQSSGAGGVFSHLRIMFTIVPTIMIIIGLIVFGQSFWKVLSRKPVVAGDGQGLRVIGRGFKTHRLQWDEIDYLRYDLRGRDSHFRSNDVSYYRQSQWLIVKPKNGRSIEVNITTIDGTIDDIVSDVKSLVPQMVIKGVE